jgi:hypothetical protein
LTLAFPWGSVPSGLALSFFSAIRQIPYDFNFFFFQG